MAIGVTACADPPPFTPAPYPETGLVLLSLRDGARAASASIGSDLVAVIVSRDGQTAYLADSAPGDVYAVRLPSLQVAWKQHVGGAPFGLLLHQERLFVSLFSGASVVELDPSSGKTLAAVPVPQGPAAMTEDAGGHVVVAGSGGGLSVFGAEWLAAGNGFGVAEVGGRLWSADYQRSEIVLAGDDRRVRLPLPLFPFWLAPGAGTSLLITAEGRTEDTDPGGVFSFDTVTGSFQTLATPKDPDQVLFEGSTIYVAAHGDRDVLAIKSGLKKEWAAGAAALALAADPPLGFLVVAVNAHE